MLKRMAYLPLLTLIPVASLASPSASQLAFFDAVSQLCGQSFEGETVVDNAPPSQFTTSKLVMHVRSCNAVQLEIPFHVGEDASRTWVISKTADGLKLKHDHRHQDGTSDALTMYGGVTLEKGWPQVQSFPADSETKELFVSQGIPQSNGNTWQLYVYPGRFTYRMVREGREFRVDFDTSKAIATPKPAWGYKTAIAE